MMKKCSKCHEIQDKTEYHRNRKNKDGLEYTCKKCAAERFKKLTTQIPWRQQKSGFPYAKDPLKDKKYLKDRTELFKENGYGWWWGLDKPVRRPRND
jgi:RNase P subunit RPR2